MDHVISGLRPIETEEEWLAAVEFENRVRAPKPMRLCDDQDHWPTIYRTLQRTAPELGTAHRSVRVPSPLNASRAASADPRRISRIGTQDQKEVPSDLPVLTRRWLESGD